MCCPAQSLKLENPMQATQQDDWMIYHNSAAMLWDVAPDDPGDPGACGSNWSPVTEEQALEFQAEMAAKEGWSRGHTHSPRF